MKAQMYDEVGIKFFSNFQQSLETDRKPSLSTFYWLFRKNTANKNLNLKLISFISMAVQRLIKGV